MSSWLAKPLALMPLQDWVALAFFFVAWIGYALFAKRPAAGRPSILASTNRWRAEWMWQATRRSNRIVDAAITQSLAASPSFFASTSILIIGGLLAALAGSEQASELVRELPFAATTSMLVFDMKLSLLAVVFVFAFFRFTWSMRQYSFGVVVVGAMPEPEQFVDEAQRRDFGQRAGRVMALAAETFNDGLRAYYMSFAVMGWFFSAWAFLCATALVVWVLYRREFHSDVLQALNGGMPLQPH